MWETTQVRLQPWVFISRLIDSLGRTRLERLFLIGICSAFLGVEALRMGIREAKEGKDIRRYLELQTALETIGPHEPEAVRDTKWMDRTDKQNQVEAHRLEAELKGYKQNLVKESIRVSSGVLARVQLLTWI
jgi:COP9 signalosome complex subunit 1